MALSPWFILLKTTFTQNPPNFHWNGQKEIAFNCMSENPPGVFLLSICLRVLSCTLDNKETHFTGPNQIRQAWWSIAFLTGSTGEKTTKQWAVMGTHVAIKQCEASRSLTWTHLPVVEPLRELCNCSNCDYVYPVTARSYIETWAKSQQLLRRGRCAYVFVFDYTAFSSLTQSKCHFILVKTVTAFYCLRKKKVWYAVQYISLHLIHSKVINTWMDK